MFTHKDNSGAMFANSKQNEKQPDFTGSFTLNNKSYRIAAWERQGPKGKFYSFKVSDYDEQKQYIAGKPEIKADFKKEVEVKKEEPEYNDGLPF